MATRSYVTFLLNDQLFGIDIMLVREINRQLDITFTPHSPEYIKGLVNLRGQIVTIIDLKNRLGLGYCAIGPATHNIILQTDANSDYYAEELGSDEDYVSIEKKVGLLVDGIGDVITENKSNIEPPPANLGKIDGKYVSGVVKLERQLMAILSVKKVLES